MQQCLWKWICGQMEMKIKMLVMANVLECRVETRDWKISSDFRSMIMFEKFGFSHTGHIVISVINVALKSSQASLLHGLLPPHRSLPRPGSDLSYKRCLPLMKMVQSKYQGQQISREKRQNKDTEHSYDSDYHLKDPSSESNGSESEYDLADIRNAAKQILAENDKTTPFKDQRITIATDISNVKIKKGNCSKKKNVDKGGTTSCQSSLIKENTHSTPVSIVATSSSQTLHSRSASQILHSRPARDIDSLGLCRLSFVINGVICDTYGPFQKWLQTHQREVDRRQRSMKSNLTERNRRNLQLEFIEFARQECATTITIERTARASISGPMPSFPSNADIWSDPFIYVSPRYVVNLPDIWNATMGYESTECLCLWQRAVIDGEHLSDVQRRMIFESTDMDIFRMEFRKHMDRATRQLE